TARSSRSSQNRRSGRVSRCRRSSLRIRARSVRRIHQRRGRAAGEADPRSGHQRQMNETGAGRMTEKVVIGTVAELKTWVGKEVAVGRGVTGTQDLINKFAEASGDYQWIHVDVERCKKESPYKTTIAHGNLTFCLISSMTRNADVELPPSKM